MDNTTHSVFFLVSYIHSHRIKHIEFSLQNMDAAISKARTSLSLILNRMYPHYCHLQIWTGVMEPISEAARGIPKSVPFFFDCTVTLHLSPSLTLGTAKGLRFLSMECKLEQCLTHGNPHAMTLCASLSETC